MKGYSVQVYSDEIWAEVFYSFDWNRAYDEGMKWAKRGHGVRIVTPKGNCE